MSPLHKRLPTVHTHLAPVTRRPPPNMVSFKYLLLGAAAIFGVFAQDPTGDEAAATAFWESAGPGAEGVPAEKRDFGLLPRNNCPIKKDPYKGFHCSAQYTKPPCATTCNRNNCFRSFLNARDGSSGKVRALFPTTAACTPYDSRLQ